MKNDWKTFIFFTLRVVIAHTLTYFIAGILFSNLLDYGEIFKREIIRDYMVAIDDHNVILGPFLQPVRGLIFAVGLWPFRITLMEKKRGWLTLWVLLVTVGILSTPAASPGSIEGMLYSKLPMWYHLVGYPEITLQTLAFSIWLVWWEHQSLRTREIGTKKQDPLVAEIVKAIMAACFAYIGYAIGGLLLAWIANANAAKTGTGGVDIEAAGANFKMQFMFFVAFIVNTIAVFWFARKWRSNQIKLWATIVAFWLIDALVPWLYQTLVFGSSFIPTAILLGLFPAVVIGLSIKLNYKKDT